MAYKKADGWYWLQDPKRYGWEAVHVQDDRVMRIGMAGSKDIADIPDELIWRSMTYDTKIRVLKGEFQA